MLICTFLSLPLLLFATTGSRIPQQAQDGLGLYRLTFGNVGADPLSKTYASTTACHNNIVSTINGTCIHFYGNELTSLNASYVVTALEIVQIFLFYAVLAFLHSKTKTFKLSTERELASVTSYAIMVRNIPPDTTEEQLVAHFTRLYPLDKRDWMDRPVLEDAKPVNDFDNTDDVMYYNTW